MQHLDEGTIHSWLDGALSGDEAARVEAHVKECPECAAAVAEARGFIAGSSRILTALDNAPRGVIPAAAPKKRFDPFMWRVAATVLVVAAGSFVVFRNGGREAQMATASADTAAIVLKAVGPVPSDGDDDARTTPQPAPPVAIQANPSRRISSSNAQPSVGSGEQSATKTTANSAPAIPLAKKVDADRRADNDALEERVLAGRVAGSIGQQDAASSGYAAAPTAPRVVPSVEAGGYARDLAREPDRLKVVGTPRRIGMKVTLYEVAPGDTVTLTEPTMMSLSAVVTTGANVAAKGASRERAMVPQSVAGVEAAPAAAPDSQGRTVLQSAPVSKPMPAPRPPPAPVKQVEVANGVTTISWTDLITGNELKLSGRMSQARLQEIKISIERERAAAAKKTP